MKIHLYNTLLLLILVHISILTGSAQKVKVTFQIQGYNNDTLIIGNYYGSRTLVKDTLYSNKSQKGNFIWKEDTLVPQGVYLALLKPENRYIQFLINQKPDGLNLKFNANDLLNLSVSGCQENEAFYEYLTFLGKKRIESDTLKAKSERAKSDSILQKSIKTELSALDQVVKNYQNTLLKKHAGSVLALLINSNLDIQIPEFAGDEKSVQTQRYHFYKKHYFDHIDFGHPALIRTPSIHQKVFDYFDKLVVQIPDSIKTEVDLVFRLLKPNKDAFRYFLSELLTKYGKGDYIGHDDIAVHIIDQYYAKGLAPWISNENLSKLNGDADNIRPTMLNLKFPDITTYKEDNTPIRLQDIKSDFTVLFIYDPDCGTCKKAAPHLVDFHKKYGHESVNVLTICNQGGEKYANCWKSVKEKNMEQLINTGDEYQRYQSKVRNTKVPKIFLLDKNKKILLKDFPAEKLGEIYENFKKSAN